MLIYLVLAAIAFLYYIYNYYRWVARYPRGPMPLPFLGNLLSLTPEKVFKDFENYAKIHGNVFTIFMPMPMVILADYDSLKEAFVSKGDDFVGRPTDVIIEAVTYCKNGGVIQSNGESWREQRRTAISILRDFGMGKNLMEEKVKDSIRDYLRFLDGIEDKDRVDMRWPIQIMIANIINEVLFGYKYEYDKCKPLIDYVEGFRDAVEDFSKTKLIFLAMRFPWVRHVPILGWYAVGQLAYKMKKLNTYIDRSVIHALDGHQDEDDPTCFVHAYKQRMPGNALLTNDQMAATCSDFFFAGQETTATTLRWAMLLLAANPSVQEKARAEILSVVGRDRLPAMADKLRLPYTTALALEIQRRANILSMNVFHVTTVDTDVQGVKIPAGAYVNGDIHQIMATDPLFTNPEELRPERYLLGDGKTFDKKAVEHTVPFSIGKRQCAGEGLARVELFLGLAATLQAYRILPPVDGSGIDLEPEYLTFHLPKPHKLRLVPV